MGFWVYMLRCSDGSYYTGHTEDLKMRVAQHEADAMRSCHTLERPPLLLVYALECESRGEALDAQRQIRRWSRAKKDALSSLDFGRSSELENSDSSLAIAVGGEDVPVRPAGTIETPSRTAPNQQPNPPVFSLQDERWMHHALALAARAETELDEIPVGAVLIDANGKIVAEGCNRTIGTHDPTAHAEIVALRAAGQALQNYRFVGTTLYVTLEPCAMCAMALVHARVSRVVYAASDPKTGAAGSVFDLLGSKRHNHRIRIDAGLLGDEAGARLTRYFRRKRGKPD